MSENATTEYTEEDAEQIKQLLMGRTVTKVSEDTLRLDDGRTLKLVGHDGGCACNAGCYDLTVLNDCPVNAVMDVEIVREDHDYDGYGWEGDTTYRLFVLAQDTRIELATFGGTDGNGYYGTGFSIFVTRPCD